MLCACSRIGEKNRPASHEFRYAVCARVTSRYSKLCGLWTVDSNQQHWFFGSFLFYCCRSVFFFFASFLLLLLLLGAPFRNPIIPFHPDVHKCVVCASDLTVVLSLLEYTSASACTPITQTHHQLLSSRRINNKGVRRRGETLSLSLSFAILHITIHLSIFVINFSFIGERAMFILFLSFSLFFFLFSSNQWTNEV